MSERIVYVIELRLCTRLVGTILDVDRLLREGVEVANGVNSVRIRIGFLDAEPLRLRSVLAIGIEVSSVARVGASDIHSQAIRLVDEGEGAIIVLANRPSLRIGAVVVPLLDISARHKLSARNVKHLSGAYDRYDIVAIGIAVEIEPLGTSSI